MVECSKIRYRKNDKQVFCENIKTVVSEQGICGNCRRFWKDGKPPEKASDNPVLVPLRPCTDIKNVLPTFADIVKDFAGSMFKWMRSGFKVVQKETLDNRIAKCTPCPHFNKPFGGMCGLCHCTKLKIHLKHERCIIGEWEAEP